MTRRAIRVTKFKRQASHQDRATRPALALFCVHGTRRQRHSRGRIDRLFGTPGTSTAVGQHASRLRARMMNAYHIIMVI